MRRLRQALEDTGLDQHGEAVRHSPVLHDAAVHDASDVIAEVCHLGSRTTLTRGPTMMAVYPPDEALRRAQPLPPRERLVIEDVSQDDWTAFQEALAEK
jgi:hypothetical protein